MALFDLASYVKGNRVFNAAIASDTATNTSIVDTADYDDGFVFFVGAQAYTDGSYAISFQEGDASDLSDATTVTDDQIIGTLPTVGAEFGTDGEFAKVGIFSNKRYVRGVITSTSVTSGATLVAITVQGGEYLPIP